MQGREIAAKFDPDVLYCGHKEEVDNVPPCLLCGGEMFAEYRGSMKLLNITLWYYDIIEFAYADYGEVYIWAHKVCLNMKKEQK